MSAMRVLVAEFVRILAGAATGQNSHELCYHEFCYGS